MGVGTLGIFVFKDAKQKEEIPIQKFKIPYVHLQHDVM